LQGLQLSPEVFLPLGESGKQLSRIKRFSQLSAGYQLHEDQVDGQLGDRRQAGIGFQESLGTARLAGLQT
jgi:hypothetical protein